LRRLLLGVSLAAFTAVSLAQPRSDWEEQNRDRLWSEEKMELPGFPVPERLIRFDAGPATAFRFYIDPASLKVGGDGVVRYSLVARSASGAENITYEGIRCRTRESRVYAVGRPEGTWSGRPGEWGPLRPWQAALSRDYFCPLRAPIRSAEEGLQALRQGGHPAIRVQQVP
jgi:hypothetical protein